MAIPDFPPWASGFSRAYKKFRAPAQGSVHQLERFCAPWIPAWRLAQQDEQDFSRERHWTLRLTFWCFLWQVAQVGSSCRDAVRQAIALRVAQGLPAPKDDSAAYCVARAKLPVERLDEIHRQVVQDAQGLVRQGDLWCGHRVRVLDGTCVTLADTPANQAAFPQPNVQKAGCGFPVTRILASFCLATGLIMQWVTGHWYQNELSLLAALLESFSAGEVLLGDRGFGNFPVLAQCLARGLDGVFRANTGKRRVDLRQGKRLGKDDRLVVWRHGEKPKYMSADYWAQLPDEITVRVVRVQAPVPGFRTRSVLLVTTLLDPVKYPPQALAQLYLRRWEMELCFRHLKTTLQMEHLSCKSPAMIDRELRLHFLSHNLVWSAASLWRLPDATACRCSALVSRAPSARPAHLRRGVPAGAESKGSAAGPRATLPTPGRRSGARASRPTRTQSRQAPAQTVSAPNSSTPPLSRNPPPKPLPPPRTQTQFYWGLTKRHSGQVLGALLSWQDWFGVVLGPSPSELNDPDTASGPQRFYCAVVR